MLHLRKFGALLGLALIATAATAQTPQKFVVKDVRDIEPNSVRFAAGQISDKSQAVVIFGGTKESWPTIKSAVQKAEQQGCPVVAILVGPVNLPPALEIYALAHDVTVDGINPNTISQAALTKLICDIYKEYYSPSGFWKGKRHD
jgi:hypothetical protein